jgi:hypothetical protein
MSAAMKRAAFLFMCLPLAACDGCSGCSKDKEPVTPRSTASSASATSSATSLPPTIASKLPPRPSDTSSAPASFGDYHNEKFKFRVQIPSTFIPEAPSADGDRQTWKTPDGKAEIVVTGRSGPGDLAAQFAERTKADGQKLTITQKLKQHDYFLVQGTEGGHIFYEQRIFAADRHVILTLRFKEMTMPDDIIRIIQTLRFD